MQEYLLAETLHDLKDESAELLITRIHGNTWQNIVQSISHVSASRRKKKKRFIG